MQLQQSASYIQAELEFRRHVDCIALALLAAAGKADVLGSLDDNDADADDQELDDGAADISSLADQLGAAKIAP